MKVCQTSSLSLLVSTLALFAASPALSADLPEKNQNCAKCEAARKALEELDEIERRQATQRELLLSIIGQEDSGEVRLTDGGDGKKYRFVRDTSVAALGPDAFRDERGLIWGDLVKKADGTLATLNWEQAKDYCLNLNPVSERARIKSDIEAGREPKSGVFLPLRANFVSLRGDLGATNPESSYQGYRPQLSIANLENWSWSSSPSGLSDADVFVGGNGYIVFSGYRDYDGTFRCAAR